MATRRELTDRIRGIEGIGQITRVMQAVAMAKAGRAQAAAQAARPYHQSLRQVIGRTAHAARRARHPLLRARDIRRACFVVLTADQGLSGGFDRPMLRRAEKEARAYGAVRFVPVGRRGTAYFTFRNRDIAASFTGLDDSAFPGEARAIARFVMEGFGAGDFDAVFLVFSEFVSFFEHRTVAQPLLPVPVRALAEALPGGETRRPYIFEPDAGKVLEAVLPRFVDEAVLHALLESKASEHAARLAAMDGATRSAGDIVRRLTQRLHRVRQAAITGELLDIVSARKVLEE